MKALFSIILAIAALPEIFPLSNRYLPPQLPAAGISSHAHKHPSPQQFQQRSSVQHAAASNVVSSSPAPAIVTGNSKGARIAAAAPYNKYLPPMPSAQSLQHHLPHSTGTLSHYPAASTAQAHAIPVQQNYRSNNAASKHIVSSTSHMTAMPMRHYNAPLGKQQFSSPQRALTHQSIAFSGNSANKPHVAAASYAKPVFTGSGYNYMQSQQPRISNSAAATSGGGGSAHFNKHPTFTHMSAAPTAKYIAPTQATSSVHQYQSQHISHSAHSAHSAQKGSYRVSAHKTHASHGTPGFSAASAQAQHSKVFDGPAKSGGHSAQFSGYSAPAHNFATLAATGTYAGSSRHQSRAQSAKGNLAHSTGEIGTQYAANGGYL